MTIDHRQMHSAVDRLLGAEPFAEGVLHFLVDLTIALGNGEGDRGVDDPFGLTGGQAEALAELRALIATDNGVTEEDLWSYLWEDAELGPRLIAIAESRQVPSKSAHE